MVTGNAALKNMLSAGYKTWVFLGVVLLVLLPAVVPLSAFRFYIYLASVILLYGLAATSCNLPLGYGGIYQFHHAVFYGAGAYGTALAITRMGISPWIAFLCGPAVSALLALIMGLICMRLSKLYFGMLQISLGSLVWAVVYRWYSFTGGDDGIQGIPVPDVLASARGAYYFVLAVTGVSFFALYRIIKSPFGIALQGIRDNPVRSEMIGINVMAHQLVTLVIAGFFAGVAGVLFVVVDNTVFPDMLFWTLSMELIIMCLLGGMYNFFGPLTGAAIVIFIRTFSGSFVEFLTSSAIGLFGGAISESAADSLMAFAASFSSYWTLVLGVICILVIFFVPNGVLGFFDRLKEKGREAVAVGE
ncbi:MAG: branched-chain amino acid ABC transporter permease [Syntrophus sp. (in: bacteria)]|nr:branched-chain amino acid ABC transporter permease [Syntrophus sp. (in: bacteria)]